uniref:Uncharacterized protein n=1 Tax=Arundo donax TaxID=35708 RepID=A0A0A9BEJ2_ARUDO
MSSMLPSSVYVRREDRRYSPKSTTPQNVLTSGSARTESAAA